MHWIWSGYWAISAAFVASPTSRYYSRIIQTVESPGTSTHLEFWRPRRGAEGDYPRKELDTDPSVDNASSQQQTFDIFDRFCDFLTQTQRDIIQELEDMEAKQGSAATFSKDVWGLFNEDNADSQENPAGGVTRVLQGGKVIEKGACSLTLIRQGTLTPERARTVRQRQDIEIEAGDTYAAAALSMVLHTTSPLVPTFRSDVRIFLVQNSRTHECLAWFGGGADLTPYYVQESDITFFHTQYKDLCDRFFPDQDEPHPFGYRALKEECDDYFYLPARSEHRGTGGIFFDDMPATLTNSNFVQQVAHTWMPSWLPIVEKRAKLTFTEQQKQWQLLRRGRYLEFNLLYDRGVKFGLANANPRVEGVMVSAPPLIAYEYNHEIKKGSEEAKLVEILRNPRQWV